LAFSLDDAGTKTMLNVLPGAYNVTETVGSIGNYLLTNINCSAGNLAPTSTSTTTGVTAFTMSAGKTLECTYTNTRQKVQSSMDTAPWYYPNDKATVRAGTGQTDVTGSVTFKLYDTSAHCTSNGATGLLYTQTVNLSATAGTSKDVNTSNPGGGSPGATSVKIPGDSSANPVYWRVSYSGDTNHFGRLSDCVENINATLTGDTNGTNVP
jgi:hypothetical protein